MLQEKGAGAPAGKDALKPGQVPKGRGFFTSAWSSAGPDKKDSPEQKKGVVTDPDMAPPKPETGKHDTPSSQKTNELVCNPFEAQLPAVLYSLLLILQSLCLHHLGMSGKLWQHSNPYNNKVCLLKSCGMVSL